MKKPYTIKQFIHNSENNFYNKDYRKQALDFLELTNSEIQIEHAGLAVPPNWGEEEHLSFNVKLKRGERESISLSSTHLY